MPGRFRQQCLTTLLAATYLVVGATGESLYYLLESPSVERAAEGNAEGSHDSGYFHDHGHGHGHWHRHTSHGLETQHAAGAAQRDAAPGEPGARSERLVKHDHTCFLLAVAEAIELSLRTGLPALEAPTTRVLVAARNDACVVPSDGASLGPRGPPRNGQA